MSTPDLSSSPTRDPGWTPTRRTVLKSGTAAMASLSAAPTALASIGVPPKWPASGAVVLEFNVTPAPAKVARP